MLLLCDLDGVVWLAHQPLPGSVEALKSWRAAGHEIVFCTNNSFSTIADQESFLAAIGIEASNRVVSSATAAGSLVQAGEDVLVCGGPGIVEAVTDRGATAVVHGENLADVDAVIVGFDRTFDYLKLKTASAAVRSGARLIGTNHDPTYPTPEGEIPGGGSLVAAVAYASETEAIFAGKPMRPMFAAAMSVAKRLVGRAVDVNEIFVVGDRDDSDGEFARRNGVQFCHVKTGVKTPPSSGVKSFPDLAAVVSQLLGARDA